MGQASRQRWQSLWQLFLVRVRSFVREPVAVFWVYGFPILMATGLGLAFSSRKPEPPPVDIQQTGTAEDAALHERLQQAGLRVELHDEAACRERLRRAKTALVVVPAPDQYRYVYDEYRPESAAARYQVDDLVQRWKRGAWPTQDDLVAEVGNRYIDFLIPGLMGLNLMGGGLWGVGFVLVDLRVRKLLKRLAATPMRHGDFLLSILLGRLLFLLPEMAALLALGCFVFGVPLRGNLATLAVVVVVGASAFSGIGLLIGCRTERTETASGLMNLVLLPMWLLSGTFFSAQRFPDAMQPVVQALPLTQLNNALRAVILEGAGLPQVVWPLLILAAWAAVTFTLALRWFRWQ